MSTCVDGIAGDVDDDGDSMLNRDWFEYWRLLFPEVTIQRIDDFQVQYKGLNV